MVHKEVWAHLLGKRPVAGRVAKLGGLRRRIGRCRGAPGPCRRSAYRCAGRCVSARNTRTRTYSGVAPRRARSKTAMVVPFHRRGPLWGSDQLWANRYRQESARPRGLGRSAAQGVSVVLAYLPGQDAVDPGPNHLRERVLRALAVAGVIEGIGACPCQPDAFVELEDGQQPRVAGAVTRRRLDHERGAEEVKDWWPAGAYTQSWPARWRNGLAASKGETPPPGQASTTRSNDWERLSRRDFRP